MTLESTESNAEKPRSRWRWLVYIALFVSVVVLIWWAYNWWTDRQEQAILDEVIAQVEARDPMWRLDHLLAELPEVPDNENGALCSLAAYGMLPKEGLSHEFEQTLCELAPNELLTSEQAKRLREYLDSAAPALAEARKMSELPRGRFPIDFSKFTGDTLTFVTPQNEMRGAANLLSLDAMLQSQIGDLRAALVSCRAIWNETLYVRDEPEYFLHLVSLSCQWVAMWRLQRILGHGEIGDPELAHWQNLFQEEEQYPWLWRVLRSERASEDRYFARVAEGAIPQNELANRWGTNRPDRFRTGWKGVDSLLEAQEIRAIIGSPKLRRVEKLRYYTKEMAIAELPPEERVAASSEGQLNNFDIQSKTRFRCMTALLAVERFRLAQDIWPNNLEELVPRYLGSIPVDPYANAPLRFKRVADGVVVYSVGKDGTDNGGDVDTRHPGDDWAGKDIGFRLWDPDKRRQPPVPKKAEEKTP